MDKLSAAAHRLEGQPMFKLLSRAQELERQGAKICHLEIGDPDFDSPPQVVEAAIDALKKGKTHYVNSLGILELREALCGLTHKELGFTPSPAQILIAPANSVIYFLVNCVVNPGEEVIIPDPGFPTYAAAIKLVGATPVRVPLLERNSFRMNPEDILRRLTKKTRLIILNSPQNPTGSVMTEEEINAVFEIARERDLYLLTDEVYRKMSYDQKTYSVAMRDECKERVIFLNSFSKSHSMTGWRLGYAIGPEFLIKKLGLMVETIVSCLPPFIQYAGIQAIENNYVFTSKMMAELKERRDFLIRGLNALPGVSCLMPQGAFYAFPNISGTGLSSRQFADLILEKGNVALLPGTDFGEYGEGYVRICYAVKKQILEQALLRMREALSCHPIKNYLEAVPS